MASKRISRVGIKISGRIGEIARAIPAGIPPVLRKFWRFAREMAQRFSKQLIKNREEEFLKTVRKDFE